VCAVFRCVAHGIVVTNSQWDWAEHKSTNLEIESIARNEKREAVTDIAIARIPRVLDCCNMTLK